MITAPDPSVVSAATPVLQGVVHRLLNRPWWAAKEPLAVDPETYQRASHEMTEVLRARGWSGPGKCPDIRRPNFYLMGVPVFCADE
jgi:hypothetical protein